MSKLAELKSEFPLLIEELQRLNYGMVYDPIKEVLHYYKSPMPKRYLTLAQMELKEQEIRGKLYNSKVEIL